MAKLSSLMARVLALVFLTTLAAVTPAEEPDRPDLRLRVQPRVSLAPLGGLKSILLTAEIVGPEAEEYYCPEVVWVWSDSTQSSVESDCDPFEERSEYPRRFTRRVRTPSSPVDYRVCVVLRKDGDPIDRSCVRFAVH